MASPVEAVEEAEPLAASIEGLAFRGRLLATTESIGPIIATLVSHGGTLTPHEVGEKGSLDIVEAGELALVIAFINNVAMP